MIFDILNTLSRDWQQKVSKGKPIAVICNVGHRAGLGASILLWAGYPSVYNVLDSVKAWVAADFPVTTDEAFKH